MPFSHRAPTGSALLCLAGCAGALSFLFAGCAAEKPQNLQVEINGCETWTDGPVCTIGKENLRIWVGGDDNLKIELDQNEQLLGPKLAGNGQQFELAVPSTASQLRIRRARGGPPFELALEPSIYPAWFRELDGKSEEEAQRLVASKDDREASWKLYLQARFAYQRGDRKLAVNLAKKGADSFLAQERIGHAVNELAFASHLLAGEGFYPESREALDKARTILDTTADWPVLPVRLHYLVGHQRAVLAHFTGDVRTALASLEELEIFGRDQHQVLTDEDVSDRDQMKANVLAELGRFEEAAELLERLRSLKLSEGQQAMLELNRGWIALVARQGGASDVDPRPFFEAAWSYYSEHGLGRQKLNTQINLAWTAILDRRLGAAEAHLIKARDLEKEGTVRERSQLDELKNRMLLLSGEPRAALDGFRRLAAQESGRNLPDARWQALIGIAESLAALGRQTEAVEAFELAEQLESQELIFIPFNKGRETFLARRESTTRQHLELLFAQQLRDEAFELVRRRRVQALALLQRDERVASFGPEARRNWEKAAAGYRQLQRELEASDPAQEVAPRASRTGSRQPERSERLGTLLDEAFAELGLPGGEAALPPVREGELTLAFFPRDRAWLIFALDNAGLEIREKTVAPGTRLENVAADLLVLVKPRIEACRRIRILSWGSLDFHALPFEGEPLVAKRPIVYGVDVGGEPARGPGSINSVGNRIVLVADSAKLRWAQKEIHFAAETLAVRPDFQLEKKLASRDAKAETVRQALERADFFHFAGHGEFDRAGSQSRLVLRDGELTAGDVFTLKKVPSRVLLSSCHVGQAARASGVEGLGLAYAFVLAGSRQVLAATRKVDDGDTAKLIYALYDHIGKNTGEIDLAAALREAQVKLSRDGDNQAWRAFRVFEP